LGINPFRVGALPQQNPQVSLVATKYPSIYSSKISFLKTIVFVVKIPKNFWTGTYLAERITAFHWRLLRGWQKSQVSQVAIISRKHLLRFTFKQRGALPQQNPPVSLKLLSRVSIYGVSHSIRAWCFTTTKPTGLSRVSIYGVSLEAPSGLALYRNKTHRFISRSEERQFISRKHLLHFTKAIISRSELLRFTFNSSRLAKPTSFTGG
jgi:hypothetical protein